jgi:hypothetical protein
MISTIFVQPEPKMAQQTTAPMLGANGALVGTRHLSGVHSASKVRTVIFFGIILARLAAFIVFGFLIALQVVEAALAIDAVQ